MADAPGEDDTPERLRAITDAHVSCAAASGAVADGWLIEGISVRLHDRSIGTA